MSDIRIGVVGLGNWGKNVVRCFSRARGAELAMICDSDPKRLAIQQALYPRAQCVEDFAAVLADDTLDAVALVTPAPTHYALARQLLEAGKHLFVEKPLTLSADEAEALCDLADARQRTLMVGHLLEYHPAVNWMKEYLQRGDLGQIFYMYSQRLNLGVVRSDENAFWSLAPHDISVILYLFAAEPDAVSAHGANYLQPGVEDVVFANLHFADGRVAQIHVSWLDPHKERRMVLVGSKTMMVFDDMSPMEPLRIYDKGAVVAEQLSHPSTVTVRHGDSPFPICRPPSRCSSNASISSMPYAPAPRRAVTGAMVCAWCACCRRRRNRCAPRGCRLRSKACARTLSGSFVINNGRILSLFENFKERERGFHAWRFVVREMSPPIRESKNGDGYTFSRRSSHEHHQAYHRTAGIGSLREYGQGKYLSCFKRRAAVKMCTCPRFSTIWKHALVRYQREFAAWLASLGEYFQSSGFN